MTIAARRQPDIAVSHLSYWTDNGAYYYMYGGHANNPVCDNLALVDEWKRLALPVRSIQLDDWWYVGSEPDSHDHMCVKELIPKPELFPAGLPKLPEEISYHLYGPFYCEDNVYLSKFSMVNSTLEKEKDSDPMPAASEAFYTNLFQSQRDMGVKMTNYEVDFLYDQTQWFAPYVENVDGSKTGWGGWRARRRHST